MLALTAILATGVPLAQTVLPPLIPKPVKVVVGLGTFTIDEGTRFAATGEARKVIEPLRQMLAKASGYSLPYTTTSGPGVISVSLQPNLAYLGREGYALEVSPAHVRLEAPAVGGLFYASQTLRQLLPPSVERPDDRQPESWRLPSVAIEDSPRFEWRGLHLDVSRHFFPKEEIKQYLDSMALLKLNVFHWHLVDDGGWRLQIKRYPRLTDVGAWRKTMDEVWSQGKLEFPEPEDKSPRYGGFYTQEDVREIVAYAKARNITVVPEIEMPGHSMPVMAAYPEVTCTYFAQNVWKIATGMHHATNYCPGKERTFEFLEGVLDEVMELFPSKVIHIGGDEVNKLQWNRCDDCQKRMRDERLATPEALQSWFLQRMEKYLNAKGRTMMGWDEILEGGLAPNAQVMSWRGVDGGIAAAKSGHPVVMTPTSHCYFDYSYQSISTRKAFEFEPVPEVLTAEEAKLVRGGQANVWTEWMSTWEKVETMVFPRLLGMAERLWSPASNRDADAFLARSDRFLERLDALRLAYDVPTPTPSHSALIFAKQAKLTFAPPATPGATVRYTLDGSDPTPDSPNYSEAITVADTTQVRAATFVPSGRRSEIVSVACARYVPRARTGLEPGLHLRYVEGEWDRVPDLHIETPRPVADIDPKPFLGRDKFGLEWTGYISIPSSGTYTFQLGSDDGSVLWLAGVKIVDNDGLHGYGAKSGAVDLEAGVYPFKLGYFEAGGADGVDLTVSGPGISAGPVPAAWWLREPLSPPRS
ncbi:MAG: family 20 glycosylhydrolase [Fimbriimonadaceae bacterium]|nr:family 20 glycosylhydrolase [Fimbriimonadaceae bacterium]